MQAGRSQHQLLRGSSSQKWSRDRSESRSDLHKDHGILIKTRKPAPSYFSTIDSGYALIEFKVGTQIASSGISSYHAIGLSWMLSSWHNVTPDGRLLCPRDEEVAVIHNGLRMQWDESQ